MVFTSYTYVLFLATVFLVHWTLPVSWRKPFLVGASYFFYCTWKWEFGFLLLSVALFNWAYARWILSRHPTNRLLTLGMLANLAPLVYFKYTGFILQNVSGIAGLFKITLTTPEIDIILPLGISFFTFQGIAYLFDVATGEPPLQRMLDFVLFKSFWPQLIAGPIVRIDEMRPQIAAPRTIAYDDFAYGCRRILVGFVKKVVVADTLAPIVDMVFLSNAQPSAIDAFAAVLGFGLQIYFDFSAYSDIAIGSARLFGFRLPENFNWPYTSQSPQEFWNRWHMTLSRWIRDYVFTPLTMTTRGRPRFAPMWLLVAMAICGLWHGARWTFVLWGVWHGLLLISNQTLLKGFFVNARTVPRSGWYRARALLMVGVTFGLVNLGWVLFRSQSVEQAADLLKAMITIRGGLRPAVLRENDILVVALIFAILLAVQVMWRPVDALLRHPFVVPWASVAKPVAYGLGCILVIIFAQEARAFVYFQF